MLTLLIRYQMSFTTKKTQIINFHEKIKKSNNNLGTLLTIKLILFYIFIFQLLVDFVKKVSMLLFESLKEHLTFHMSVHNINKLQYYVFYSQL